MIALHHADSHVSSHTPYTRTLSSAEVPYLALLKVYVCYGFDDFYKLRVA